MSDDINVLALVRGEERYIFLFDDANRGEALRTLGRYASNPELSFTWYDAAVLSQKIRRTTPAPASSNDGSHDELLHTEAAAQDPPHGAIPAVDRFTLPAPNGEIFPEELP